MRAMLVFFVNMCFFILNNSLKKLYSLNVCHLALSFLIRGYLSLCQPQSLSFFLTRFCVPLPVRRERLANHDVTPVVHRHVALRLAVTSIQLIKRLVPALENVCLGIVQVWVTCAIFPAVERTEEMAQEGTAPLRKLAVKYERSSELWRFSCAQGRASPFVQLPDERLAVQIEGTTNMTSFKLIVISAVDDNIVSYNIGVLSLHQRNKCFRRYLCRSKFARLAAHRQQWPVPRFSFPRLSFHGRLCVGQQNGRDLALATPRAPHVPAYFPCRSDGSRERAERRRPKLRRPGCAPPRPTLEYACRALRDCSLARGRRHAQENTRHSGKRFFRAKNAKKKAAGLNLGV